MTSLLYWLTRIFRRRCRNTASELMSQGYVVVRADDCVRQAQEAVRACCGEIGMLPSIFVLGDDGRLVGIVSLRRLVVAVGETCIGDMMDSDFRSAFPDACAADVISTIEHYKLPALPIVDRGKHLLGIITADKALSFLNRG